MATQKQSAAHIFLSERRFNSLLDQEIVTRMPSGKYELDTVRKEYITHIRDVASGRSGNIKANLDLTEERARLAKEQADSQEMKNAMQRGALVQIEDVTDVVEEQFMALRAKLLAMPTKYAALVYTSEDLKEAKLVFEEAILEALNELVGYYERASEEQAEVESDGYGGGINEAASKADSESVG